MMYVTIVLLLYTDIYIYTLILEQMDLHLAGSGNIDLCALTHCKFALIKLELVMIVSESCFCE